MKASTSVRGLALTLLGALTLVFAIAWVSQAASAKADFTLTASPTRQTAAQGSTASYALTLGVQNGFSSAVALTASNLPSGASATFSPNPVSKSTPTSTMVLSVGAATPTGTYAGIVVTGTGGGPVHTLTLTLTVTAAPTPAPTFTLAAPPTSADLLPGDTATYTVSTAAQNGFSGSITLALTAGLPSGAVASFVPNLVSVGGSTTLQVSTKNNSPSGSYLLLITGTSGTKTATTTVTLNLLATGKTFTINMAGPAVVLAPGVSRPVNLSLYNPNHQLLQVTNLTVSIQLVTKAAGAPADEACTPADYTVTQYSGTYPINVSAGGTVLLSSASSTPATWPQLTMIDSAANQDGCKGATLTLAFLGAGHGA